MTCIHTFKRCDFIEKLHRFYCLLHRKSSVHCIDACLAYELLPWPVYTFSVQQEFLIQGTRLCIGGTGTRLLHRTQSNSSQFGGRQFLYVPSSETKVDHGSSQLQILLFMTWNSEFGIWVCQLPALLYGQPQKLTHLQKQAEANEGQRLCVQYYPASYMEMQCQVSF